MNTYVLLHFEHKNNVTILIKPDKAACLQLVALYKSLTMTVMSFYVENVIKHNMSWSKC